MFRAGQCIPATFAELTIGVLPTGRGRHVAIGELRAFEIPGPIQRIENFRAEAAGLLDDCADGIGVQAVVDPALDQVRQSHRRVECEQNIFHRSLVCHWNAVAFGSGTLL